MDSHLLATILLTLAWVCTLCIGAASLAIGAMRLGHAYVFTAPGVSRLGPRLGRRLPALGFAHQGRRMSLRQVLAPDRPTLLVFFGALGGETLVKNTAVPGLRRFIGLAQGRVHVVVFCTGAGEEIGEALDAESLVDIITLPDDHLTTELGLRAMPYALLVDQQATVVEKGLVNHLEHLCVLVVRGGDKQLSRLTADLDHLTRACRSHLESHIA